MTKDKRYSLIYVAINDKGEEIGNNRGKPASFPSFASFGSIVGAIKVDHPEAVRIIFDLAV